MISIYEMWPFSKKDDPPPEEGSMRSKLVNAAREVAPGDKTHVGGVMRKMLNRRDMLAQAGKMAQGE